MHSMPSRYARKVEAVVGKLTFEGAQVLEALQRRVDSATHGLLPSKCMVHCALPL